MTMPISRAVIVVVATASLACARTSATTRAAPDSVGEITAGFSPAIRRDVETLRRATDPFHDLSAAQAAGYPVATPACVADSTMGGMGRHYFDRAVYDDTVKIEHPEMLIYAPAAGNTFRLVAVEYVIPFRLRPPTATAPRLFGQEFRKHDQFQYWYLHVWAWDKNPAGLFSDWNPNVRCT